MDERLKDRLAFMGALASGLAHEIKSPLSTMTITLGLLHEDFEGAETRRDRRALRKVELLEQEVTRLERILQDFLQFAGGHTVRPELVDPADWLDELLEFFEPSCAKAGVRIVREFADRMPPILMDRELLKRAVMNLFNNALQAMPDGGALTVRTWTPGDRVCIEVEDTGDGIDPEVLPRVLEIYFSTRATGTGLGLPTVRRIVAEHGGELSIRSDVGIGTTVRIDLPRPALLPGHEPQRLPGSTADPDDGLTYLLAPEAEPRTTSDETDENGGAR